jgi:hypothetical protein
MCLEAGCNRDNANDFPNEKPPSAGTHLLCGCTVDLRYNYTLAVTCHLAELSASGSGIFASFTAVFLNQRAELSAQSSAHRQSEPQAHLVASRQTLG